jgi:hypothetical protein
MSRTSTATMRHKAWWSIAIAEEIGVPGRAAAVVALVAAGNGAAEDAGADTTEEVAVTAGMAATVAGASNPSTQFKTGCRGEKPRHFSAPKPLPKKHN